MCEKCDRLLADPKALLEADNIKVVVGLAAAMMPAFGNVVSNTIEAGLAGDKVIHPTVVAAVFGWFYYATMTNAIHDKDIDPESFEKFNEMLKASVARDAKRSAVLFDADELLRALNDEGTIH